MSHCFYQLWSVDQLKHEQARRYGDQFKELIHTAGNRFFNLGVTPGDYIYIWSYFDGGLHLACRLCVDVITDDPSEIFDDTSHLYEDSDHILATEHSPLFFDLKLPRETVKKLEFINATGEVTGVKYLATGKINPQTFRGSRQLTYESAELLDQIYEDRIQKSDWELVSE